MTDPEPGATFDVLNQQYPTSDGNFISPTIAGELGMTDFTHMTRTQVEELYGATSKMNEHDAKLQAQEYLERLREMQRRNPIPLDGDRGIFQWGTTGSGTTGYDLADNVEAMKFQMMHEFGSKLDLPTKPFPGILTSDIPSAVKLPDPATLIVMREIETDLGESVAVEEADEIRKLLAQEEQEEIEGERRAEAKTSVERWKMKPWEPEPKPDDDIPF